MLALLIGSSVPAIARAQQPATAEPEQTDIREWIRRKRGQQPPAGTTAAAPRSGTSIFVAPLVASKPSTGVIFGVGASIEFALGSRDTTYTSSVLPAASISTKGQYSVAARLLLFGPGNRWVVIGDNHERETSQETRDPSSGTVDAGVVDATFTSTRFMNTYLGRLPGALYAGMGLLYQRQRDVAPADPEADWAQSPYVEYSERFGFDLAGQASGGLSFVVRRDSRDNISDPGRGWYMDTTYRTYIEGFFGGASTWQSFTLDTRGYVKPSKLRNDRVAGWAYVDVVTGGRAPYFALPATGTDPMGRSGRGYAEGRFRGDRLVYGEVEYRRPLRADGLVGAVVFLNATATGSTFEDDPVFDDVALGGGFGFRLRLDKRSRTNVCLDFGWGRSGSRGVYIALAEAF
jgi:hypothetical protein